jgi:hypothetical protein
MLQYPSLQLQAYAVPQTTGGASLRHQLPVDQQSCSHAGPDGGDEDEDLFWQQLVAAGDDTTHQTYGGRDVLCEDPDTGVVVRDAQGHMRVYKHSLAVFRELEEEVLRVATRYVEQYAQQLHAAGRGAEADEIDM